MERIKFNSKIIKLHLLNWLIVIILRNILITPIEEELKDRINQSLVDLFTFASAYYFVCLFISPYIRNRQWKKYLPLVVIYFIVWDHIFFLSDRILSMIYYSKYIYYTPDINEISWTTAYIFAIGALAHGFYQKQISIQQLNEQSEIEQTSLLHETMFFKNQFNSHISFNVLAFCYAKAVKNDIETSYAIETYSKMLKFSLLTKPNELVAVKKEIDYIERFILLQKQIGNEAFVVFKKSIDSASIKILPRILINYVENAFKYGISDDPNNPIFIDLQTKNDFLHFNISNIINKEFKHEKSTQTGQINSKQQLELFYPNMHEIKIIQNEDEYLCQLKIKLI